MGQISLLAVYCNHCNWWNVFHELSCPSLYFYIYIYMGICQTEEAQIHSGGWFRNPANQLRLVVYPIIYRVSYIPGGARFQPSTLSLAFWRCPISDPLFCDSSRFLLLQEKCVQYFGSCRGVLHLAY